MATQPVKVPDIGDFDSVEVIEVLVAVGDEVEAEQPLITLESDKATLEVPAPQAGKIAGLKISEGDNVSEGDIIAEMEPAVAGDSDSGDTPSESSSRSSVDAGASDRPSGDNVGSDALSGSGEQWPIKVPEIGDFDSVEVIEVLVVAGEDVEAEQPLITLESDKATLEVPAPAAGSIVDMAVGEGNTVSEGDVIGTLETAARSDDDRSGDSSAQSATASQPSGSEKTQSSDQRSSQSRASEQKQDPSSVGQFAAGGSGRSSRLDNVGEAAFSGAHASPSVRRFARQIGADLGRIEGSGRKSRILGEDVENYVKRSLDQVQQGGSGGSKAGGNLPAQPDVDFSEFGETETVELSRIRKLSASAVHNNWLLIPHVTQFESADITEMEQFRQANKEAAKAEGVKLTPLVFLLKATASALKAFPDLNSSLTADGEHLVHKHYVNIAVAVDTPNGLLMPVIKDVDKKGFYDIARDLDEVSGRAREGKIKGDDMQGACFSISSLGGVGGQAFTPIVNSPEVGILGVSKHTWQPVWQNGEFIPRLMLPLSFSYDHRVIDGAEAAHITNFISRALGDLRTLLL